MSVTIESLMEQGIEIPEDPSELAALLESDGALEPEPDTGKADAKPDAAADAGKTEEVDEAAAIEAAEKEAAEKAAADAAAAAAQSGEDDDGERGPPKALLRSYRERLHQQDRELEESRAAQEKQSQEVAALQKQLAELTAKVDAGQAQMQEQADELGTGAKLDTLTDEKIAELRKEYDDDIVDVLVSMKKGYDQLSKHVESLTETNEQLEAQADAARRQGLIDDIESVPLLGVLRLARDEEGTANWERAVQYNKAVLADPDFADASRREVYQEVGKRLAAHLGADRVKALLGSDAPVITTDPAQTVVRKAVAKADEAAVPTSLSEIPAAGSHYAQSELERADAMSTHDLATMFDKAIETGQDVDALIAKLSTSEGPI